MIKDQFEETEAFKLSKTYFDPNKTFENIEAAILGDEVSIEEVLLHAKLHNLRKIGDNHGQDEGL